MNIKIDIILGFLSSGKTRFINSMLKDEDLQDETIVIIQDEFGKNEINHDTENNKIKSIKNIDIRTRNSNEIIVLKNHEGKEIDQYFIKGIIEEYCPNRIFIECNCMKDCKKIINVFNEKTIKKLCVVDNIVSVIDAKKINLYFRNMSSIMNDHIFNSETIILNNMGMISKKESENIIKEISKINEIAHMFKCIAKLNKKSNIEDEYVEIKKHGNGFIFKTLVYLSILIFIGIYLVTIVSLKVNVPGLDSDTMQKFYTVFMSILIQGFPFILVGSFVSSIIQVCIPRDKVVKFLPKNIFLSCIIAAFSGFLFPVCDCGTIPIVRGLMKKGVSIAAGVTFMLSAPIVNPISIMSTIYAFPNMKSVVIYRVIIGIIISITVGIIMELCTKKDASIFKNQEDIIECECGFCDGSYAYNTSAMEKVRGVFIHTGDEFFKVGKFMIMGIFLSSILQNVISTNNMYIPSNNRSALVIMIGLGFIFSVCSTSDAFIAKGFLNQFPIRSIMGFLVVGPMIDIKNTIMLFGSFKKSFVLKLISIIFIVSFVVLINFTLI